MKHLGKRLRELRIKYEMSQDYVARALGVSVQAVSKWENGRSDPEISNLIPISDLFHIPVDELLEKTKHHKDWEEEWVNVIESNDSNKILQFLRSALTEFPGDYKFRYRLASEEYFAAVKESDERKQMRLLALADDHFASLRREYPEFSNAIDMHVRVLAAQGRKAEACDLAKLSVNRDRVLLSVLEGEELKDQKRKLLTMSFLNLFADLMREGSREALKKAEALLTGVGGNEAQFAEQLLDLYYQQALRFCREGNNDEAVTALQRGLQTVKSYSQEKLTSGEEKTIFYPIIPAKQKYDLLKKFESYIQDEQFSRLRDMEWFNEIATSSKKTVLINDVYRRQ